MTVTVPCGKRGRVYKNRRSVKTTVTVTVNDRCTGENSVVSLVNQEGAIVGGSEEDLEEFGGTVTYDVDPGMGIRVACNGEGEDGCEVEVAVR